MEDDRDWVKQESAESRMENAEYHEFVRKRVEAEEGNSEEVRETEGEAEVEDEEQGAEEEDEEKEEDEEEAGNSVVAEEATET
jgi:hypothetical protein